MKIATKSSLLLTFACSIFAPATVFAGSVDQFDANMFARVRDEAGHLGYDELDVARQGDVTYTDSHAEGASGISSAANYRFQTGAPAASFRADFNHIKSSVGLDGNWQVKSDGTIHFILSQATSYSIAGIYSSLSAAGLNQVVSLYNITDAANVTEVFSSEQALSGTNPSLTVGGDHGTFNGAASGTLPAGTYRFVYSVFMEPGSQGAGVGDGLGGGFGDPTYGGGPPPDHDLIGAGYVDLSLNAVPVPLPPTLYAGMGLLGIFGVRNLKKTWRKWNVV